MAFDCLFYLKMSFLAKNAKFLKNEKLIKKLRNHSVDTCILKTLHSLEAKPLGSRGQSSRKPLGLSHNKKQNQHSESPVFVSELLLLLLFSSILLTFSAIRNFFWERRSRAPVNFEALFPHEIHCNYSSQKILNSLTDFPFKLLIFFVFLKDKGLQSGCSINEYGGCHFTAIPFLK